MDVDDFNDYLVLWLLVNLGRSYGLFEGQNGPRYGTTALAHRHATPNFAVTCCQGCCGFMMLGEDEEKSKK